MPGFLQVIKLIPVLIAAMMIGNWFLSELKKARLEKKPWYAPYLTPPGILIILIVLLLPLIVKFLQ